MSARMFAGWGASAQSSLENRVTRVTGACEPQKSATSSGNPIGNPGDEDRVTAPSAVREVTLVTQATSEGLPKNTEEIQSGNLSNPGNPKFDRECEPDERAAIVEFDAGVPRDWAEGFARLDPDRPRPGVTVRRWQVFVDGCGRFLDDWWALSASRLGRTAEQVFAVHPTRPAARDDAAGLCWLLNGSKLIALSDAEAVVETTGQNPARQRIRRRPTGPGVLVWEVTP
jgi:hypothetical protein